MGDCLSSSGLVPQSSLNGIYPDPALQEVMMLYPGRLFPRKLGSTPDDGWRVPSRTISRQGYKIVVECAEAGRGRIERMVQDFLGYRRLECRATPVLEAGKNGLNRLTIRFDLEGFERHALEHFVYHLKFDPVVRSARCELGLS